MSSEEILPLDKELEEKGWELEAGISVTKQVIRRLYRSNGILYLLKIHPKRQIFSDRTLRKAVNREIMIANKVRGNFSFLAGFYDFFYTKNYAIFVYEYYSAGTLGTFFGHDQQNLLEIIVIMRDLFCGLEELKYLNIIHKNLNEDCIFQSKSTLKIGGYEYCEMNDCKKLEEFDHNFQLTVQNKCVATVPPEVLFNRTCGVKTPIYSYGVIFYKQLHQCYPSDIENVTDMTNAYLSREFYYEQREDLPPEFTYILRNALQVNYEYRQSPYDLKQELNYLYTFCKGHEEELRIAVYSKKKVGHYSMAMSTTGEQNNSKKVGQLALGKSNKDKKKNAGKGNLGELRKSKLGDGADQALFDSTMYRKQNGLPIISSSFNSKKGVNEQDKKSNFPRAQRQIIKSYLPGIVKPERQENQSNDFGGSSELDSKIKEEYYDKVN